MTEAAMDECVVLFAKGDFRSVHIGGGEPFLDFTGLLTLLKKLADANISIDFIETNACWATDEKTIAEHLSALSKLGVDTFCISADKFHAEYIPQEYPLRLAEVCEKVGFGYFIWSTNENSIRTGGRALQIELERSKPKPLSQVLSSDPCTGLMSRNHFHVDMYNRFIPPGCVGLVLPMHEVGHGIAWEKYPVYNALLNGGVAALFELAKTYGFAPENEYTSKCALCFFIRKFLSEQGKFAELDAEFYTESLKY